MKRGETLLAIDDRGHVTRGLAEFDLTASERAHREVHRGGDPKHDLADREAVVEAVPQLEDTVFVPDERALKLGELIGPVVDSTEMLLHFEGLRGCLTA
jgi:hypothetical protein